MKQLLDLKTWLILLVVLVLVVLSGISPVSRPFQQSLWQAQEAVNQAAYEDAARLVAQAAHIVPWRVDLWEKAGLYAHQGKNPELAISYLEAAKARFHLSPTGMIALGKAYQQTGQLADAIATWQQASLQAQAPVEIYPDMLEAQLCLRDYEGAIQSLTRLVQLEPGSARWQYQLGLLLAAHDPASALAPLARAEMLVSQLTQACQLVSHAIQQHLSVEEPAYLLVGAGRSLASLGEWELAAFAFQQATHMRPDYAEAWAYYAEALQHVPQTENIAPGEASYANISLHCPTFFDRNVDSSTTIMYALQRALELDAHSIPANMLNALYYQRQNRFDKALKYIQVAIRNEPDNPALYAEQGATQAMLGDAESALLSYKRAAALAPTNVLYQTLQLQFMVAYRYQLEETALPTAQKLVTKHPKNAEIMDLLGQVLELMDQPEAAKMRYHKAIELDGSYAPAYLHLGSLYFKLGKNSLSQYYLAQASALAPATSMGEQADYFLKTYFP